MPRILSFVLPFILAILAILAWWLSTVDHNYVYAQLYGDIPIDKTSSFSLAAQDRIGSNLRTLAVILGSAAVLLFLVRQRVHEFVAQGTGVQQFAREVRAKFDDFVKHTSTGHKQMVMLLIGIGVVLRGILLFQPITYDEAVTYTRLVNGPLYLILIDSTDPNNHVLHTLLCKAFTTVFGVGKLQLRLPAFLAGVMCLPLFYLFTRHMFNRYIALVALALIATTPRLIEYSALASGYSIAWLCFVVSLVLGRRFAKENDGFTGALIGIVCAIGMWAVPSMMFSALLIYFWLAFYIWDKYEDSRPQRFLKWFGSLLVFVLLSMVVYIPMWVVSGTEGLMGQGAGVERTLDLFTREYGDNALDLWAWFTDQEHFWVSFVGSIALVFAGFKSFKFRSLIAAMFLGAVPLVIYLLAVPPPPVWAYTLFIFHLGSAIAIYYFFKLLHDKGMKFFTERRRAVLASFIVMIGLGIPGMELLLEGVGRFIEAGPKAQQLSGSVKTGDLVIAQFPWDAPVEFEGIAHGLDPSVFKDTLLAKRAIHVVVGSRQKQTLSGVLAHHGLFLKDLPLFEEVDNVNGLKTFAARFEGN